MWTQPHSYLADPPVKTARFPRLRTDRAATSTVSRPQKTPFDATPGNQVLQRDPQSSPMVELLWLLLLEFASGNVCDVTEGNQKANGARRNMWGEDGNDVRLF
jgi:hypothetical protein